MSELPTHLRGALMGEERISRAVLAEHQRERVIAKATPVFAKRGYQATTVDDLLASGKVGVGNFYSLFEGKEDCFLACFDRAVGDARATIAAAAEATADWDERAYRGLAAMLDFLCGEPLAAKLVLVEVQGAGSAATARYDALLDQAVAWLTAGRLGHPEAADLPKSFERAAVSGLAFYLQQCLLEARRLSAAELLAETAVLLLEPIIGAGRLEQLSREGAARGAGQKP